MSEETDRKAILDEVLRTVPATRRRFLRKLLLGAAFAAPAITTFSLTPRPAQAGPRGDLKGLFRRLFGPNQSLPIFGPNQSLPIFSPNQTLPIFGPNQALPIFGPNQTFPIFGPNQKWPIFGPNQTFPHAR